ncbi:aldehyde dehydrogenase family protein [Arthrobacter echini]|uniref:aldehyde dehydrogenase family protein n=1 Tax=Arthrobacter echini TaxID=1529066 RepID=UPI001B3B5CDE|nr:aldehyde dehydrogenase family protein [Arthrobacter echini]
MAARFEARKEDLLEVLMTENGKVRAHAEVEFGFVPDTLRFNAALALTESGHVSSVEAGVLDWVIGQPMGVAGIIAPWNSPIALGIRSLAPAAGCTVAFHLPWQTAHTNSLIAEVVSETEDLPRGVVNFFNGGTETGQVLVKSPDVPSISFTGSTATGRVISEQEAEHLKRFALELGSKTPLVVFDDADLGEAVEKAVLALAVFAGQFCMTGSRLLVQSGVADEVRSRLKDALEALVVGPASDPDSQMGPVIDQANADRIDGVVQQEIFGPVLTMEVFDTEEQAVQMSNATEYRLAASIWTRDVDRALRVAEAIDAGTIWINDRAALYDQFEEGGFKASGTGRMRGSAVLDDFLELTHISIKPGVTGR